jgi:hypothetical protein
VRAKPAASKNGIPTRAALAKTVCVKGRPVLEQRLHVGAGAIKSRLDKTSDGSPQCDFVVTAGSGKPVSLWVSLDNAPQPYQVLDRRSVEEGQNFGFVKHFKTPKSIKHVGLIAWWFPREQQMQTTDGRILITVTIDHWAQQRGAAPRIALSTALTRPYLGPLKRGAHLVAS